MAEAETVAAFMLLAGTNQIAYEPWRRAEILRGIEMSAPVPYVTYVELYPHSRRTAHALRADLVYGLPHKGALGWLCRPIEGDGYLRLVLDSSPEARTLNNLFDHR